MFGCASRELKEEEKAFGMTVETFAYDGIAAIVHPDNTVSDISMEDLKKIYTGERRQLEGTLAEMTPPSSSYPEKMDLEQNQPLKS
ncbi:MAG: substrate-binding domain-containing protein [Clostridia bacterium]